MRRTAISECVLCVLLSACTTDLDRFRIGAAAVSSAGSGAGAGAAAAAPEAGAGGEVASAGARAPDAAMPNADMDAAADAGSDAGPACTAVTVYDDRDEDTYGDLASGRSACVTAGLVTRADDCDDDDEERNPDATEICSNATDDNCNGSEDEGCDCEADMTKPCGTFIGGVLEERGECQAGTQACVDGKWQDDCQGWIGPVVESCNDLDDDCDANTDERLPTRYVNVDGDGYGDEAAEGCALVPGIVANSEDCDDDNPLAYPGASEECDGAARSDCNTDTDPRCPTRLPAKPPTCPPLVTGSSTLFGMDVRLWVGLRNEAQPAPIYVYFHATGQTGMSTASWTPRPVDVAALGGLVIAPNVTTGEGASTHEGTWHVGDFDPIDQIIGCALSQLHIDARRIYVAGVSTGGVQAAVMAYHRSGYIAAALTNSGGISIPSLAVLQDPQHVPSVMTMHGRMGSDFVIVDFATISRWFAMDIDAKGGFAVDCDHDTGHAAAPASLTAAGAQFLLDHPFAVTPEPYSPLPEEFPNICTIID